VPVKLLCFQARRFAWRGHSKTLDDAEDEPPAGAADDAVVVFFHAERKDEEPDERASVFRKTLKHVKWLANKRELRNVVLHSFTHLGAENAAPDFARGFVAELTERLEGTGYAVQSTPFGWFCAWELAVFGESLAKVWKEV
jgi:Archaea-specific editing domain of threonyl-tRNA synthetase